MLQPRSGVAQGGVHPAPAFATPFDTQHPAPIRPATAADRTVIRAIVRAARLNPTGLDWRRFLVAVDPEAGGRIVGVAQIKPHRDGSRELASLAVVPGRQGGGIGDALVHALLARETGPLYLMCAGPLAGYYTRFGFRRVGPAGLPPYFRRVHRAARIAGATVFRGLGDLAILRREAGEPGGAAARGARTGDAPRPDLRPHGIDSHWLKSGPTARTLLVVLAHPDDESFGSGGTLARYGAEGVAVHYACATRGECGTVDPALLAAGESVAALRTGELLCAADALGLAGVHFLGYRDSGMPDTPDNRHPDALVQAPPARVTGQIVAIIRALRPRVVITFPPYSGYGHPDHIRVHETALAAFHAAGNPAQYPEQPAAGLAPWTPAKLYYGTVGPALLRLALVVIRLSGRNPRRFGENGDVNLVRALHRLTPVTTVVGSGPYLARKDAAWRCHRSQLGPQARLLALRPALRRRLAGSEAFTRAIPPWPGGRRERDFWAEGVDHQGP